MAYSAESDQTQYRMVSILSDIVATVVEGLPSVTVLPTGDGAIIVFENATATRAVESAHAIHTEIANRLLSLPIRIGIHTGAGYRLLDRAGNQNWAGSTLNLAQRVMDIGDTGHVLLSSAAAEQLANDHDYAGSLVPLTANPVRVMHGVEIDVSTYQHRGIGHHREPAASSRGSEIVNATIGRPAGWETMFPAAPLIRALDLSMPVLGNPALIDHLTSLTRTGMTEVRILLLHPASPAAYQRRTSPAYKDVGELHTTIEYVVKILLGLRRSLEPYGQHALDQIDVRLTDTVPSFCGVLAGGTGHVNIYLEHLTGSRGPYLEVTDAYRQVAQSMLAEFERSFDVLWARSPSLFNDDLSAHHSLMIAAHREFLAEAFPAYLQSPHT